MLLKKTLWALVLMAIPSITMAQSQFMLNTEEPNNSANEPAPVHPVPSPRQLKWQTTEFYAFFHYGMNTYTGLEWGNGDESESTFAPTQVPNPRQWLETVKKAGMKGGIAVVKHHDGFCLWPTATTTHNCSQSSNSNAQQTNIPRDFAAAAQALGMKYGFYVSPWDRNSYYYGTDTYVKDVFLRQCAELAAYGNDQFEMWFDGANGGSGYYGGRNTTVSVDRATYYDVPNLRDSVHKVCPDCVLWGVGGESRWIGNEAGWAGETNWSPENRGYAGEGNGMYGSENGWFWLPGESDAKSTSGGWFWHSGQTNTTAERLFQMYLETVGRNATLILNCPPNQAGLLPDADVTTMTSLGNLLKERLAVPVEESTSTAATDYAKTANSVVASATRSAGVGRDYEVSNLLDDSQDTYWATDDNTNTATITFTWNTAQTLRYVQLMEYIKLGQRIRDFKVEYSTDGNTFTELASSITSTVGYKRIIPLNGSTSSSYGSGYQAKALRITIVDSKACPTLSNISIF